MPFFKEQVSCSPAVLVDCKLRNRNFSEAICHPDYMRQIKPVASRCPFF
ncbi:hypothetical protein [Methanosarcina sp. UBA5]|nr:hypothetical protein [Methanosarcina sp. UBA5]